MQLLSIHCPLLVLLNVVVATFSASTSIAQSAAPIVSPSERTTVAPSSDEALSAPPRDQTRDQTHDQPPDQTLDERIDATKITTLKQPPSVSLADAQRAVPPTAIHRVAARGAQIPLDDATFARARTAITRALAALAKLQTTRGTWFENQEVTPTDMEPRARAASVAVTAMALKAFVQAATIDADDALDTRDVNTNANIIARQRARNAIDAVLADPVALAAVLNGGMGNYVMSSIASGLAAVGDSDARANADRAVRWLRDSQWDEAEGVDATKDWYGGAGYGNGKRPDLSNTQMMLDAMHDAGVSADDPAMQRALAFVARTQNRKSTNPADWAQNGSNDGGFVYTPANGGESFASDAAGEGRSGEKLATKSLRSYGAMTYAGFKSMLYAGLSQDDPRVKDALAWIARHFTFAENPGLGQQGYFYYVHAMSRALLASQRNTITDDKDEVHNWRAELIDALIARQRADGTWCNEVARWEESNVALATIYAALALEEAIKPTLVHE